MPLPFAELLALPALTLATVSPSGEPHAASVYFACDEKLAFYFLSAASSQHSRDLAAQPAAALTLEPFTPRWQEICGLQLRGMASELTAPLQQAAAWARYLRKFPYVKDLQLEVLKNRWYAFTPHWLRWIDNRVRFGYKMEWSGAELSRLIAEGGADMKEGGGDV